MDPLIDHKKIEEEEPFLFEIAPDRKKEREIYSELAQMSAILERTGSGKQVPLEHSQLTGYVNGCDKFGGPYVCMLSEESKHIEPGTVA